MTNILDTVARAEGQFTPRRPQEYLALQIARKLNDLNALRHYLVLFEHYPEELLLSVFRTCLDHDNATGADFMRTFREVTGQGHEV